MTLRALHLRRTLPLAGAAALMVGLLVASGQEARGDNPGWRAGPTQPPIPTDDETMARQLQLGGRRCQGAYAQTMLALTPTGENQPGKSFVYCLRNVATYEQVYYGRDGKLKHRYLKATAHGTGFAYRWTGQETLVLTNHHVAEWPDVTDEENKVSGVPMGARKVREDVFIVRNDEDDFEPGYIPLSRVVTDNTLDAAVLKTRNKLNVLPHAIGSSAGLRAGTAVEVRGYPLGAFAASNVGKVTNPYVEDLEGSWNHGDFAFDALVNKGNSGSPVLAVSCQTGEYELVGLFHAGYREGEAMNLAVGIDDLRPLMDKLTATPRQRNDVSSMTPDARRALATTLTAQDGPLLMRFGKGLAEVRLVDEDMFSFRIYGENYPADPYVFIQLDEVVEGSDTPPRVTVQRALESPYVVPEEMMDAETREHLDRVVTSLLTRVARMQQYREVAGEPPRSQARHRRAERLLRELSRQEKEQQEQLDVLGTHLERALVMMRNAPVVTGDGVQPPQASAPTVNAPSEEATPTTATP
ncbi:MAG: serine protease [Myxococcota bacterium]